MTSTEPRFSFFTGGITQTRPRENITIEQLRDRIASDTYAPIIADIRKCRDPGQQQILKNSLDYCTPGGVCQKREKDGMTPSGYAVIDIDGLDDANAAKESLKADPYVLLLFISPRGGGVKIMLRVEPNAKRYEAHVGAFYQYLRTTYDLKGDAATKDISRACFVSHDPNVFYNPDARVFDGSQTDKPSAAKSGAPKTNGPKPNITDTDKSRSGREFAEVCCLIRQGATDEQIREEMTAFAKWSGARESYRALTIKKARDAVSADILTVHAQTDKTNEEACTLDDCHRAVDAYLHLEDYDLLDTLLAVAVSRAQKLCKLWLIVVGASSGAKTEILKLLDDEGRTTKTIKQLTDKTLVNGHANKAQHPDLAPKLRDKLVLLPELASVLTLHPNIKAAVWAQLRDLYDGYAAKASGDGADVLYRDLNVSLIGCSTNAIDNQVLIHQSLGTRELVFRLSLVQEKSALMDRVVNNLDKAHKQRLFQQARAVTRRFIDSHSFMNDPIQPSTLSRIQKLAVALTQLRATADVDWRTGELTNFVTPEEPARVLEQLLVFFKSVKSLGRRIDDARCLVLVERLVSGSCDPVRVKVLKTLIDHGDEFVGRRIIANSLNIGNSTVYASVNVLTALGLAERVESVPSIQSHPEQVIIRWRAVRGNPTVELFQQFLCGVRVTEEDVT